MLRSKLLITTFASLPLLAASPAAATGYVAPPAPPPATGVTFDGSVTAGVSFSTISEIGGIEPDLTGYSLDFEGDLGLSPNFSVGLGFSFATSDLSVDGLPNDINIDLIGLSIEPMYRHESGAYVGVYYRMGDLDVALIGPLTIGVDTSQYGVFGGYDFGQGHVEVFYGVSDLEEDALLGGFGDVDITDYGFSGSYMVTSELEVFGSVLRTDFESGGTELSITAYAIGAEYDFGNGLGVYGSVGGSVFDLSDLGAPDDVTAIGVTLGASYDLRQAGAGVPLILNAEYSRTMVDLDVLLPGLEPEIDRFAIGVTIPFGNGGDLLNSNTRTARGDYRSAAAAIFNSL